MTLQTLITLRAFRSASKLICCTNSFGEQSHSDLKLLVLCSECVSRLKNLRCQRYFLKECYSFSSRQQLAVLGADHWDDDRKHSV